MAREEQAALVAWLRRPAGEWLTVTDQLENHGRLRVAVAEAVPNLILCVPKTSCRLCDQAIFVDQATGVSLPSDAVPLEIVAWNGD